MADYYLKYNTAGHVYRKLIKHGDDLQAIDTDYTYAAGDFKVSLDGGGSWANLSGTPTYKANGIWDIPIGASELLTIELIVAITDAAGGPVIGDDWFTVQTFGHASAMFPDHFEQAIVGNVQADTDDLQTRLPASLNGGFMRSSVEQILANMITATAIQAAAFTAGKFAADAIDSNAVASSAVTEIQSGLATLGALSALATAAALATAQADLDDLQTRVPASLNAGLMRSAVEAMGADTVDAAALKADAGTEIATAVNSALTTAHGSGSWQTGSGGGGGGGGGAGIYPIAVSVEDGSSVGIADVNVQVYADDQLTPVTDSQWTEVDGTFTFMLDPGDYFLRVRSSPRYQTVADQVFTVDSSGIVSAGSTTAVLTLWEPPLPAAPSVCRVWVDTRELGRGVAAGVEVDFQPSFGGAIEVPAAFLAVTRVQKLVTGPDGRGYVDLPWSSTLDPVDSADVQYQVTSKECRINKKVTVPDQGRITLSELIS